MIKRLPTFALMTLGSMALGTALVPTSLSADDTWFAPEAWGGRASIGYEMRKDELGAPGDPETGTGEPRFWYTESEDLVGKLYLWAQWKARPFRRSTKFEIGYERHEFAEGEILGRDIYSFELKQGLSKNSRLEFGLEYTPQIYVTHRRDKNAGPGDPVFRPEAYAQTSIELGYRRTLREEAYATVFVSYDNRDETRWFEERDRKRGGVGLALDFLLGSSINAKPEYEFRVSRSRNEPDLGSDLSYREHVTQLRLKAGIRDAGVGPWDLELRTRWKFRHYTTDNPEDTRRFHRNEQIYTWSVKLERPSGVVTPFLSGELTGRFIDVAGDQEVEIVDEDDYDRTLLQLGMEWEL